MVNTAIGLRVGILETPLAGAMLALPPEVLGAGVRTHPGQRMAGINYEVQARNAIRKAVVIQAKVAEAMDVTENTLTYGMFLLALSYFRIMNQLAKLKAIYSGSTAREAEEHFAGMGNAAARAAAEAAAGEKGGGAQEQGGGAAGMGAAAQAAMGLSKEVYDKASAERKRMINALRARLVRDSAKQNAFAKAAMGYAAVVGREAAKHAAAKELARIRNAKTRVREDAAVVIQKAFRLFRVNQTLGDLHAQRALNDEYEGLRTYAATSIQACWRGFMGRQVVKDKRKELADVMRMFRKQDAEATAKKFYEGNPLAKMLSSGGALGALLGGGKAQPTGEEGGEPEGAAADGVKGMSASASAGGDALAAAAAAMRREAEEDNAKRWVANAQPIGGISKEGKDPYGPKGAEGRNALKEADVAEKPPAEVNVGALGRDEKFYGVRSPRPETQTLPAPGVARAAAARPYARKSAPAIAIELSSAFMNRGLDRDAAVLEPNLATGREPAPYIQYLPRTEPLLETYRDVYSGRVTEGDALLLTGYASKRAAIIAEEQAAAAAEEVAALAALEAQRAADAAMAKKMGMSRADYEKARKAAAAAQAVTAAGGGGGGK